MSHRAGVLGGRGGGTRALLALTAALAVGGTLGAGPVGRSRGPHRHARRASLESAIERAREIDQEEVSGSYTQRDLRLIAGNRALLRALRRGEDATAEATARLQMTNSPGHITRISVVDSGRVLVNALWNGNGFFVIAPLAQPLTFHGRNLGELLVSVQDVIGWVKLVHNVTGAQVLVRGASGQARTSLPAAAHTSLPDSGTVTIAGTEYEVGTLHILGWGGEALTAWILVAA